MGRLGRLALSFCCSFGGDSSRWSDSYTSAGKLEGDDGVLRFRQVKVS
jgi:hypothetical protein